MSKNRTETKASRRDFLKQLGFVGGGLAFGDRTAPGRMTGLQRVMHAAAVDPPLAVQVMTRMGFGPRPGDVATFNNLGGDDLARVNAYIDQQLAPGGIADTDYENRLIEFGGSTLNKTQTQLWQEHVVPRPEWRIRMAPFFETERLTFLRALFSKKQLAEVLADFWHNHFNVFGDDYYIGPMFVHYDRDVIRPHLFGNFREMLEAVAKSPAMLYFLDNIDNRAGSPNENWARELFELHGMGAENYMGVMPQEDVPVEDSWPIAYVDEDVYQAVYCFTGWSLNEDTGQFMFNSEDHASYQKWVLGRKIDPFQGINDGYEVLDLIAEHPRTGRYISRKLCKRLISDNPPESLVLSAAQIFYDNRAAPDQLKTVVEHILRSPEFTSNWGAKVKRPFEYIVSALRALDFNLTIRPDHDPSNSFMWNYGFTGHALFRWRPPDGYPDFNEAWLSTTPLVMSWRMVKWLTGFKEDDVYFADIVGQTPQNLTTAAELVDFWIDRLLYRPLDAPVRQEIVSFMAQDDGVDTPLPVWQEAWPGEKYRNRLRVMVSLILQTPAFQQR